VVDALTEQTPGPAYRLALRDGLSAPQTQARMRGSASRFPRQGICAQPSLAFQRELAVCPGIFFLSQWRPLGNLEDGGIAVQEDGVLVGDVAAIRLLAVCGAVNAAS
jgi:hypothetical protein